MKVKTILVSQPEQSENSPYHQIIEKYKVKIDFRPFTEVQGVTGKESYSHYPHQQKCRGSFLQSS